MVTVPQRRVSTTVFALGERVTTSEGAGRWSDVVVECRVPFTIVKINREC